MTSINMMSLQKWITTIINIIVTTQPMNMDTTKKNMAQTC